MVEQVCTPSSHYVCDLDAAASDNVTGLPIRVAMTDNNDGTYWASYTITGSTGTVSISALLYVQGAFTAEYWENRDMDGAPVATTQDQTQINEDWDRGKPSAVSVADNFSVKYSGAIRAPTTDTYDFEHMIDDVGIFTINGDSLRRFFGSTPIAVLTTALEVGEIYPFTLNWEEHSADTYCILSWQTSSMAAMHVIPTSAYYAQKRIGNGSVYGTVNNVEIYPTLEPTQCTVETSPSTYIATDPSPYYTLTMQSRDINGLAHDDLGRDTYSVDFTRSDGGGSETYSATAIAQGSGLYEASLSPTVAGTYTVTVTVGDAYTGPAEISGSPFMVTVLPGTVDPAQCSANVLSTQVAGTSFKLTVTFVDT